MSTTGCCLTEVVQEASVQITFTNIKNNRAIGLEMKNVNFRR